MSQRLDRELVSRKLASTRSQAESLIRLGLVEVSGRVAKKAGQAVSSDQRIAVLKDEVYVSRAGLKLASVADDLNVDFRGKVVLDVGSSTGGFTDYALKHGAKRVVAVDVGTEQLHPKLREDPRVELYEKTDIRSVAVEGRADSSSISISTELDVIVVDVSFISLRDILPRLRKNLMNKKCILLAMVKPQFEAGKNQVSKGVIKNNRLRREILSDFEAWAKRYFVILDKRDSQVAGAKGNLERFYKLQVLSSGHL